MLVLSRKLGERIIVPSCEMSVTVVAIEGNTVRLGIAAREGRGLPRRALAAGLRRKSNRLRSIRMGGLSPVTYE